MTHLRRKFALVALLGRPLVRGLGYLARAAPGRGCWVSPGVVARETAAGGRAARGHPEDAMWHSGRPRGRRRVNGLAHGLPASALPSL